VSVIKGRKRNTLGNQKVKKCIPPPWGSMRNKIRPLHRNGKKGNTVGLGYAVLKKPPSQKGYTPSSHPNRRKTFPLGVTKNWNELSNSSLI